MMAYDLAKKACYRLRHELVPVFGADFVDDCIPPFARGFGSIQLTCEPTAARRRASECVVGQRQSLLGPQQLRLHQNHNHLSLKRRYSSNDVSRLGQSNGPTSQLSSALFLLNHRKHYEQSPRVDGDLDDDVELGMDEDQHVRHGRDIADKPDRQRFHRDGRYNSICNNDDNDNEDMDSSTEDEEDRQSLSGFHDDNGIDIDRESCVSEQEDPTHGLARLDLSRRNSSPMPLNTAYALSGSGTKSLRTRRGRPPTRTPLPMVNQIAANYVPYNNYISSNTQVAQGLGRNSGPSARARKQQLRQKQQLNELQQNQNQNQNHYQQEQRQQQEQQQCHPLQAPTSQQQLLVDQDYAAFRAADSTPSLTHQELVGILNAGQALQRLFQDDGVRPWEQDSGRMILPNMVILGEQVFQCVGGEWCVPEPNNSSTNPPGENEGWSR